MLAFVEFTSGVLQGFYSPTFTDIARHLGIADGDVNWFEGGQLMLAALVDALPLTVVLLVPGLLVAACCAVIAFGVRVEDLRLPGRLDLIGLSILAVSLVAFTRGLGLFRLQGAGSLVAWAVILLGLALLVPFTRHELRHPDPFLDVRMMRSPALLPVFVTAALLGVSLLGAQGPFSTFVRTDPSVHGYGFGASSSIASLLIACYLVAMICGALSYPRAAARFGPRAALVAAAGCVGLGYLLMLHDVHWQVLMNICLSGLGSGALVAAIPAAAAVAAICGVTGLIAATVLGCVPKRAFSDDETAPVR